MNIRRGAIAFVAIALLASAALALDIPPKPTQWVNDYNANLLNASQIQQLNEKLEGFYKKTGVQFLIMIFPSLEGEDDLGYANKVANVWKVKDDKAVMLFVFAKEHKTRIQVGYSLEPVITDAFSSDVLHNTVPTYFRAGDYAGGLNAAADQIIGKIDPTAVGVTSGPSRTRARSTRSSRGNNPAAATAGCAALMGSLVMIPILLVVLTIAMLVWVARDSKARGMDGAVLWIILVMFTNILGLILYLLSRPSGNLMRCPHCANKKLQVSARCPHCGHSSLEPVPATVLP
jgi:uncharacterized protein